MVRAVVGPGGLGLPVIPSERYVPNVPICAQAVEAMTQSDKSDSEPVTVGLSQHDWDQLLGLLQTLGSGTYVSANNPEAVLALRDRLVKQLP